MEYKIENRMGDYYAVLDEIYKNSTLCVNLSTILKVELISNSYKESKDSTWFLSYEDGITYLNFSIESDTFKKELDLNMLLESLVYCIKNNCTINECTYLNNAINDLYTEAFFINSEDFILFSDERIIKAEVRIRDSEDNLIGKASRFIVTQHKIILLEYVGKKLEDENDVSIVEILKDNIFMSFGVLRLENVVIQDNDIKYYELDSCYRGLFDSNYVDEEEKKEIKYIPNLPNSYTSPDAMYKYIVEHNNSEDIVKYKASVKEKVRLININNFIINDFNI